MSKFCLKILQNHCIYNFPKARGVAAKEAGVCGVETTKTMCQVKIILLYKKRRLDFARKQ